LADFALSREPTARAIDPAADRDIGQARGKDAIRHLRKIAVQGFLTGIQIIFTKTMHPRFMSLSGAAP
jgi:hypothetical protein